MGEARAGTGATAAERGPSLPGPIKVERPGGKSLRRRDVSPVAAPPFAMLNANKRLARADNKAGRGRDVPPGLLATAEMLAENPRPA